MASPPPKNKIKARQDIWRCFFHRRWKLTFQIMYTFTFLSHQYTKTYWHTDLESTYAEIRVGEQERGCYIAFHEQVKIYPVCNSRGFPISLHGIPMFDWAWAPIDSESLFTCTVAAKSLLVIKGFCFPICKMGLKPSSQYYLSYGKALCKMKKSLLRLIWIPCLQRKLKPALSIFKGLGNYEGKRD